MSSREVNPNVNWETVATNSLLERCHSVCVEYQGDVYIHGGLAFMKQSGQPLSSVIKWNIASNDISQVKTTGSPPSLSHHTANLVGHVMVLTGGWDGKCRLSKIWALSLKTLAWIQIEHLEDLYPNVPILTMQYQILC